MTNSTIRITSNTRLSDVIGWRFGLNTNIIVTGAVGFEPGVQGVAMAALRTLAHCLTPIGLVCEFVEPETREEIADGFFGTPFGFSLARLSSQISFARGPATDTFKALVGTAYSTALGAFGSGKIQSLISVDPRFPVPPRLATQNTIDSFPPPSLFGRELQRMVASMGFSQILSSRTEESIVSLAYELQKNTYEHGIPKTGRLGRSTRALLLEKIVIDRDVSTRQLSFDLKNYLSRLTDGVGNEVELGVLCLTIADQGEGIQGTLPLELGETESDRLTRAFVEGISRKPFGAASRGMGLPKAIAAAHRLNALIQVCSAGLYAVQDFSTGDYKYPKLDLGEIKILTDQLKFGTSISIFIPEFARNLDQASLFNERS